LQIHLRGNLAQCAAMGRTNDNSSRYCWMSDSREQTSAKISVVFCLTSTEFGANIEE